MDERVDDVRGGTERNASTLELFFDLVYVFAITQVVSFIHPEPTMAGLARGTLLLFLLWWTWSTYTWTTNWTGTSSLQLKLFVMTAMGATLVMGISVPDSFDSSSRLFGISYFGVRALVAGLYWYESRDYVVQRAAFLTFWPLSTLAALVVLIGGFTSGTSLIILFLIGAVLDLIGAVNAGRGAWAVDAAHFAERNGLFVIIALGESVVGLGLTAASVDLDLAHVLALVVSFAGVASLWWGYFDRAAPHAERQFTRLSGRARGRFARDVYTLMHYPLVVGVVVYAVGLAAVVENPLIRPTFITRLTVAGGTALVLATVAAGTYRAMRLVTTERLAATGALIAIIWLGASLSAVVFAGITVVVSVTALSVEHRHPWPAADEGVV